MFSIRLVIADRLHLAGLVALDERRRMGLPDLASLATTTSAVFVQISESAARKYLSPINCSSEEIAVPWDSLLPGEVNINGFGWAELTGISEQRAVEFLVAFRAGAAQRELQALRDRVSRLEIELAARDADDEDDDDDDDD